MHSALQRCGHSLSLFALCTRLARKCRYQFTMSRLALRFLSVAKSQSTAQRLGTDRIQRFTGRARQALFFPRPKSLPAGGIDIKIRTWESFSSCPPPNRLVEFGLRGYISDLTSATVNPGALVSSEGLEREVVCKSSEKPSRSLSHEPEA